MEPNNNSPYSSIFSGDSSTVDPIFSTISLQSLLTFNPSFFTNDNFHTFTDDPPLPNLPESASDHHNSLIVPKTEHPFHLPPLQDFLPFQQPFNFFPTFPPPQQQPFDSNSFHRLPQLIPSPENQKTTQPPPPKQQQQQQPQSSVRGKSPLIPQSKIARQRRQKLSEKTRCLQKLMPWDKKMDQATLFEEAYKYVKFLQAQFSVLQSMSSLSHTPTKNNNNNYGGGAANGGGGGGVFGDLEKLNRNQMLQILVNSPVAQTKLYSTGCCVFSIEQFSLLKRLAERRQQQQQQQQNMSDHASSKTFFH